MSNQSHRGAVPSGPLTRGGDRRILELDEALRGVEAMSGALPGLGFARDGTRATHAKFHHLGTPGRIINGTVIQPLPYFNWFKVQAGEGNGWIACCMTAPGSFMPLGPKSLNMPGPNDSVLVFKPQGLNFGFILCSIPGPIADGQVVCPDWVSQGSAAGVKREEGYKFPLTGMFKRGGVIDWSDQRPQDQTPLEQGWITATGLAITIDDDMIQVRGSEMSGLWCTIYDNWTRLAGGQLLIESFVHELDAGDDEGESRYFHGVATYPHEALGQYRQGQEWTQEFSDQAVQYTSHKGKVDLPDGQEDLQPIYRYQEYGGYLGQGHVRLVMKPAKESGKRQFRQSDAPDVGLFMESIALDGAYTMLSAKSVHIGKRCKFVVPKQIQPQQAKSGDDAEADNYKFSSLFGAGDEHKVGDVRIEGEVKSALRVAAVMDLIAYDINWKFPHPFHYHKADYKTWNPSEMTAFARNQEAIGYGGNSFYVADPPAIKLTIDHRYGQVEYFERESFIRFFDDGSVHVAGGAGEELVFAGGRARITAPKGIDMCPGSDFTVLADQIMCRARGSIDFSSTDKDIRFKSERNMQFVAGNSGRGGMLFESKGKGSNQQYKDKFGEDVRSSGIVFRASEGVASILAQNIYLRTGGADLGEGDILLDASQGKRRVQVFAKEFHTYTTKAVTFNYGPIEKSSTVNKVYYFGEKTFIADVKALIGGKVISYSGAGGKGGVIIDGGCYGMKSFATAGVMADKKGMFLGKVPGGFAGLLQSALNAAAEAVTALKLAGEQRHQATIVQKYYQTDQMGDAELIKMLRFSFRDPPDSTSQYKTQQFQWPESRWQQFVRFGLGSGGTPWTEKPVLYQGRQTYPWPGKAKWSEEPTFLELSGLKMFDTANGQDADRPGPYETDPSIGELEPTVPDGHYTLTR